MKRFGDDDDDGEEQKEEEVATAEGGQRKWENPASVMSAHFPRWMDGACIDISCKLLFIG